MPEGAVPGFRHDVFVSYAHADDGLVAGANVGFVTQLVKDLKEEVGRKVGKKLDIWWDRFKVTGNMDLEEILTAAGGSASIVVIGSRAYLTSRWCTDEYKRFFEQMRSRQSAASRSVFFVTMEPVVQERLPNGLRDLPGYEFYRTVNERGTVRPLRPELVSDNELYYNRLSELAQDITDRLDNLIVSPIVSPIASPEGEKPPPIDSSKPCVLLLEVTDDLVQRRAELKDYLQQLGIAVLPDKRYSRDDMALHSEQMVADLRRSRACVQILGPLAGDRDDDPQGMAWFRYKTIRDSGETVPFLQWRDPDLDLQPVTDKDVLALITPPSVRTDRFPDFRRAVSELALKVPTAVKSKERRNSPSVFVNFDPLDRDLGADVAQRLANDGFMVLEPPQSTEDSREDWETNLRLCDSHMLLYGQTKPVWVRSQILLGNKVNRERPLMLCVGVGPPPPEAGRDKVQDLGLRYNGIYYVNLLNGDTEYQKLAAKLREFHAHD